jgi:hypothetical protein
VADDPLGKVMQQVLDSNANPRVIVLVAHGLIELMINRVAAQ